MSASHTPGPWEVDRTYQWQSKVRSQAEGHTDQWVVDCSYRREDPAATLANACLIAAAPELLTEAAEICAILDRYCEPGGEGFAYGYDGIGEEVARRHKSLTAALAKVAGA